MVRRLVEAGVDVFRLNCSHGTHEEFGADIENIRRTSAELDRAVAILLDLQGPKIRTGALAGGVPVFLDEAERLVLTTEAVAGTKGRVSTTYEALAKDVRAGDRILVSDGLIELRVTEVRGGEVSCQVVHGGMLKEHQGINLPGVPLSTPALTEKDRRDLAWGLEAGVDYVALSFVRRPEDVAALAEAMGERRVPVIAKIEKPEAVEHLGAIVRAADGLMVARGDLGVEMAPEEVPVIQKQLILLAIRHGRPVITATQMLESMVHHPRPTRAEASDVANAIIDGTDAVMLSEETAVGDYPVEAVGVMNRIAAETERRLFDGTIQESDLWLGYRKDYVAEGREARRLGALADAACEAADEIGAAAIVPFTMTGRTAGVVSQRRPRARVFMLTPDEGVRRRAALWWGVEPLRVEAFEDTDRMIENGEGVLLGRGLVEVGDTLICIAGSSTNTPGGTNLMKIHALDGENPYEE
jgi:pyruvate kinase